MKNEAVALDRTYTHYEINKVKIVEALQKLPVPQVYLGSGTGEYSSGVNPDGRHWGSAKVRHEFVHFVYESREVAVFAAEVLTPVLGAAPKLYSSDEDRYGLGAVFFRVHIETTYKELLKGVNELSGDHKTDLQAVFKSVDRANTDHLEIKEAGAKSQESQPSILASMCLVQ